VVFIIVISRTRFLVMWNTHSTPRQHKRITYATSFTTWIVAVKKPHPHTVTTCCCNKL
jgi:hypothetical protein